MFKMRTIAVTLVVVFIVCTNAHTNPPDIDHDHNGDGVLDAADHPELDNTYSTGCHDHDGDGDTDADDHPDWGNGNHDHDGDGDTDLDDHPCPPQAKHAKGAKGSKHSTHNPNHIDPTHDHNHIEHTHPTHDSDHTHPPHDHDHFDSTHDSDHIEHTHPTHDPQHTHPTHAHAHGYEDNRDEQKVQNEGQDVINDSNINEKSNNINGVYIAVICVVAFLLIGGIIIGLWSWHMKVTKQSKNGHVVVNDIEEESVKEGVEIDIVDGMDNNDENETLNIQTDTTLPN